MTRHPAITEKGKPLAESALEEKVLLALGRPGYRPLGARDLARALRLADSARHVFERVLGHLERTGQIARVKQGDRYALPLAVDLIPGRIRMNRQGAGRLQPDDPKRGALVVPQDATSTAMHGDRVLVRLDVKPRVGRARRPSEATARVVRVLERARTRIVGTLQKGRQLYYVIPDEPRISQDIFVPPPADVGRPVREGDKVVVELREWKSRHANPEGEIIEVLGRPDAEGVDMLSVIRQHELPLHFPRKVLQEVSALSPQVSAAETTGRVDCRRDPVITIDPEDAKDFDDALCLKRAGDHQWKVWVHIADVSHYVKPGTALDEEAARRGNSTYLVDRVIPMLPEALSNELCSLKPQVDRLTRCVEFLLADDGQVLRTQFHSAVIRSQRRYNYGEALQVLRRAPLDALERMLHEAHRLAQRIRRRRFQAGSLDLDFPETKIRLDEKGDILRLETVENDISHQLIEEYMLLANEAVAARLMSLNRPAIYRIHEPPAPQRLEEFREDVLSHHVHCGNLSNRHEIQALLERLSRLPIGPALKVGFLRSLMRARYSVEPLGHYGLAKKKYTHFTSPIRRYADLVVHRALFPQPGRPLATGPLQEVADHISETERNSDDAERDSKDVKLFAYLAKQLRSGSPQGYPALITDVRNFGFFVDVPGLALSGLVPVSGLSDDFYGFEAGRSQLVGRRTKRTFKLGDRVEVKVAKIDTFKRQVDFALASPAQGSPPRGNRPCR